MARSFLYRFLAKAYEYPSEEGWSWLCAAETQTACRSAVQTLNESVGRDFLNSLTNDGFTPFAADYIASFSHAARGSCPLNEIEYGDLKADPLFQPHRLADLAAFYRAFGLEISEDAGERQDHICIELEFMSVLAAKEAFALEQQTGRVELAVCRQTQREFLREHLGRWTPAFARRLSSAVGSSTLGALAGFTHEFIAAECRNAGVPAGSEELLLRPVDEAGESLCASCGIRNLPPGALETT
ncbi:MAG: molecular chaperone TorD family protein [Verrucomicrobia bacterium]|nr:molecular chaperone TorD family protein [Verrucomicrobiota bacterium]